MQNNKLFYENLRAAKLSEYGTELDSWIWILVKQYKDRTHFLFELLQNAEDAKATSVRFLLKRNGFIIEHDGMPFSKEDVNSITKIARSTKTNGSTIGRFGIGFKSVYSYTLTPRIYSGDFNFEIRSFVKPYEIRKNEISTGFTTRIEIPFNNEEVSASKAFSEIQKALHEQIEDTTLLFLNYVSEVEINIEGETKVISISREDVERKDANGNVLDLNLRYAKRDICSGKETEEVLQDFLLFTDLEEEETKIAFKVKNHKIQPAASTPVYTFFPSDKESHQAFYIHAPFETTPARDNIVEDSERNEHFLKQVCECIKYAFCWARDYDYLTVESISATYPIYKYPDNTIFKAIYQCGIDLIKEGEGIIPADNRGFKNKDQLLMPDNMNIVRVFSDDDIHSLFNSYQLFWAAKELATNAYYDYRQYLKNNFALRTVYWKDIIPRLSAQFLKLKNREWFASLFDSIESFCTTDPVSRSSSKINVSAIPFVRTASGKQVTAFEDNKPLVYLNNPQNCPNKIEDSFLKDPIIKSYYERVLCIPLYNVERIVMDNILPKYNSRSEIVVSVTDLRENIDDLLFIRDGLKTSSTLLSQVQKAYILTDGKRWYQPREIHIPSGYSESIPEYGLLPNTKKLVFLSMEYRHNPDLTSDFFKSLGCAASLRFINIDKEMYLDLVKKLQGYTVKNEIEKLLYKEYQRGINWDIMLEGFPDALKEVDLEKSKKIAKYLNKVANSFEISGKLFASRNNSFRDSSTDNMTIYSGLGLVISYMPWLYNKAGEQVAAINVQKNELADEYENYNKLLGILPFKLQDPAIQKILDRIENEKDRDTLLSLLQNPEKLTEVTKAFDRAKIKEKKGGRSIGDAITAGNRKGTTIKPSEKYGDEVEPVGNPDRRVKKLEEEFAESMDQKIALKNYKLHYTYHKTSNEEKEFLKQQYYGGRCQICNQFIEKYDHTLYFEAINTISTYNLAEEYKNADATGWNSLCLCPNCAAKYRYGTKDLSEFVVQVEGKRVTPGDDSFVEVHIELQNEDVAVHYTPKHFLALQTALNFFKKSNN